MVARAMALSKEPLASTGFFPKRSINGPATNDMGICGRKSKLMSVPPWAMSKPKRARSSGRVAPRKATNVPKAKVPAHAVTIRYDLAVCRGVLGAGIISAFLLASHRSYSACLHVSAGIPGPEYARLQKENLRPRYEIIAFVYYSLG